MKNYVIINGVNSLTITGLAISKLPSISKPPLRVMTEEINGRDGDLITELGYGAYDKELVIGLYGNYDINEVIGFFNQEGTIVFSNEDDKYYNFKIINQIDYEALIKFRTATINLHCQPFKYPLTETPEEITTEYVEDEGETLTLNDTKIAPLTIDLKGNTTQNGTPTPTSPIPVNVVSGDNEVVVCGKNIQANEWQVGRYDGSATTTNIHLKITNASLFEENQSYVIQFKSTNSNYKSKSIYLQSTNGEAFFGSIGYDSTNQIYYCTKTMSSTEINLFSGSQVRLAVFVSGGVSSGDITEGMITKGNTIQTSYEPYTSQNYPLYLGVENLLNPVGTNVSSNGITFVNNGNGTFTVNGTATDNVAIPLTNLTTYPITLNANETYSQTLYILSGDFGLSNKVSIVPAFKNGGGTITYNYFKSTKDDLVSTKTTTETMYAHTYNLYIGTGAVITNCTFKVQLEKGAKANSYTPYGTTPIELNKIGTYQDYIYKDSGKWYLHKEVGKVFLNGSESWEDRPNFSACDRFVLNYTLRNTNFNGFSNYFEIDNGINLGSNYPRLRFNNTQIVVNFSAKGTTTVSQFKEWLSTHNTIGYYVLSTPTETEITNTSLINQLEALKGAMSYEGQTNISQVNNDLPFILKVKGTKEGSGEGIINNIGNIYAKPIIELEGTGTIGIYKNGTQFFEVDMSSDNEITIDTEKMEAYHNGVLKNRKVIGDYNKFTIDEGNNNIEITGELTKATITKYTRWL